MAAEDHYSFTPGNDRLVDVYLRAKIDIGDISGLGANARFFHDVDVCSARPHELVRGHAPAPVPYRDAAEGQQWYFFSPARFVGKSQTRRSRTVDGSNNKESWHAEGSPKPVEGSSTDGYLQKFSYHIRTAPGSIEKPGWIMAEYSFNDTKAGGLVLSKIYMSPRGPGRSKVSSSSSSTSSAKSGCKRKATDVDGQQHLEPAPPSTRPRQADEDDDAMLFAETIERDLLSHDDDHVVVPELGEATQHVEESQTEPEPQLAPATIDDMTALQNMEAFLMTEEDGMTPGAPYGEDTVESYMRFFSHSHDDDHVAAPELGETMQHVEEESQPKPELQLAPATGDDNMTALQNMEAFLMTEEEEDGMTLGAPYNEDTVEYYMRFFGHSHDEPVTIDKLLVEGPSTSFPHQC